MKFITENYLTQNQFHFYCYSFKYNTLEIPKWITNSYIFIKTPSNYPIKFNSVLIDFIFTEFYSILGVWFFDFWSYPNKSSQCGTKTQTQMNHRQKRSTEMNNNNSKCVGRKNFLVVDSVCLTSNLIIYFGDFSIQLFANFL